MKKQPPLTDAERQRLCRKRKAESVVVIGTSFHKDVVELCLVRAGEAADLYKRDPRKAGEVLGRYVENLIEDY